MAIHISEPGRPQGTRLPQIFRGRRVGTLEETRESRPLRENGGQPADDESQQANARRAVAQYGQTGGAEPEQRAYLPVSTVCSPELYFIPATSTVSTALDTMDQHGVHHIVVTTGSLVGGLVDTRWILSWLHGNPDQGTHQTFQHIELPAFLTASPETDAHQLARLMLAHQLDSALVVEADGTPTGVVTSTDYLKLYAGVSRQEGEV